jgi:hypothetical protein
MCIVSFILPLDSLFLPSCRLPLAACRLPFDAYFWPPAVWNLKQCYDAATLWKFTDNPSFAYPGFSREEMRIVGGLFAYGPKGLARSMKSGNPTQYANIIYKVNIKLLVATRRCS